ncbi:MAG: hypothetical protein Q8R18_01170 [bacterium]|nr:hypothetical protein [bacterium]
MRPKEFSQDEFDLVLQRSQELIRKGYFSGINFLQSENTLPREHIVIHFLHNSKTYLEGILSQTSFQGRVIPRYTMYKTRPEYFTSQDFLEKYKDAIFIHEGQHISLEDALRIQNKISVLNPEQDLVIPYEEKSHLAEVVKKLQEVDRASKGRWIDPVLIVRSQDSLSLTDFASQDCVSLTKEKEEFYTLLSSVQKKKKVIRYLKKLCKERPLGNLSYEDIVFSLSLVNSEFLRYLEKV